MRFNSWGMWGCAIALLAAAAVHGCKDKNDGTGVGGQAGADAAPATGGASGTGGKASIGGDAGGAGTGGAASTGGRSGDRGSGGASGTSPDGGLADAAAAPGGIDGGRADVPADTGAAGRGGSGGQSNPGADAGIGNVGGTNIIPLVDGGLPVCAAGTITGGGCTPGTRDCTRTSGTETCTCIMPGRWVCALN
jgi:hypothetical protein